MEMLNNFYLSELGDGGEFKGFSIVAEGVPYLQGVSEIIPNKKNLKTITSSLQSLGFTVREIDTTNSDENTTNIIGTRTEKLLYQVPREIETFKLQKQNIHWFIFYYTGFIKDSDLIMPWGSTNIINLIQDMNELLAGTPKMFLFECTHLPGPDQDAVSNFENVSGSDYLLCFSTQFGCRSFHGEVSWWTDHLSKQLINSQKLNYNMIESMDSIALQFKNTIFNSSKDPTRIGCPLYYNRLDDKILKFPQFQPLEELEAASPFPLQKSVTIFLLYAHEDRPDGDPYVLRLVDALYQLNFIVECDLYFTQSDMSLSQWIVHSLENCDYTMIVGSPTLRDLMLNGETQPINHNNRTLHFSGSVIYSNLLNPRFTQKLIPVVLHESYMTLRPESLFPSPISGNEIYYLREVPESPSHIRFSLPAPDFTKIFCRLQNIKLGPRMKNPFNYLDAYTGFTPRKIVNCGIDPALSAHLQEFIGGDIGLLASVVSEGLQKNEWKFLARHLGLKEGKISELEYDWERDGLQEVKIKMLLDWRKQDDEATYLKLCNSLRKIQCNSVVLDVHKHIAEKYKKY